MDILRDCFFNRSISMGFIDEKSIHPMTIKNLFAYSCKLSEFGGFFASILSAGGGFLPNGKIDPGHTAGIFPNSKNAWTGTPGFIQVEDAPKPPSTRYTANASLLMASENIFGFLFGQDRKQTLENIQNTEVSMNDCPIKLIEQSRAHVLYTDIAV